MNLAIIVLIALRRRRAGRARRCPGPLDAAGPDDSDRLAGACEAPRCGEVVTFRACERRFIVAGRRRR
jgi:hypothetical protein